MRKMGSRGGARVAVLFVILALALAVANVVIVVTSGETAVLNANDLPPLLTARYATAPGTIIFLAACPLLLGLLAAFVAGRKPIAAAIPAPAAPAALLGPPPEASALRLLGLLQQEGRLIDFLGEDIANYNDAQIGAAVRGIHAGCRKALEGRIELGKIFEQEEGSTVEIAEGFDPAALRLTGNVTGKPPFRGTLEHAGWRVTKVQLPESPGKVDLAILTPAEVQIS